MRVIMIGLRAACAEATLWSPRTLHPRKNAATRATPVNRRFICPPLLAQRDDTNGKDVAVLRWNGKAVFHRQLANERRGLGTRNGGLHAGANEPLRIVERLPRMAGRRRANLVGVSAAAIALIEPGAAVDEQLNGGFPPLQRSAHQRCAPCAVGAVRIEREVE